MPLSAPHAEPHPPYLWVEQTKDLPQVIEALENETVIGVDLECDSMFHYHERVCLIQIATRRQNFVVDPIRVEDISPLAPIFSNPDTEKVFHGADYDMRSLYRDFRIEVHSLFDTQIAARFLGVKETGLGNLLAERFSVIADKKYQKKDWSQRPLPEAMIQYAVQDIHYLLPLSDMLKQELEEKGLMSCVVEENELLSRVRPESGDNRPFFLHFKGAARLDPRSLAVLEALLRFRDQEARRRDCPHFKVLGNKPILEMVQLKPVTKAQLHTIDGLSPKLIRHIGPRVIQSIKDGLGLPKAALPVYPRGPRQRPSAKVAARVKTLKAWRDHMGERLDVDPALICTNAQIQAIAGRNPQTPGELASTEGIKKWQIERFGADICATLKGVHHPK
ncbi:MAG: HRDC domain-containing protein [Deltaproteobacteria bacterium]|nr:HRDC domain-containing protein [Deltaproteobacteria bacterium]